jgi:hypothetical protein
LRDKYLERKLKILKRKEYGDESYKMKGCRRKSENKNKEGETKKENK